MGLLVNVLCATSKYEIRKILLVYVVWRREKMIEADNFGAMLLGLADFLGHLATILG